MGREKTALIFLPKAGFSLARSTLERLEDNHKNCCASSCAVRADPKGSATVAKNLALLKIS
jgi:hypothetical protein